MARFLPNALQHGKGLGSGPLVWLAGLLYRRLPSLFNVLWRCVSAPVQQMSALTKPCAAAADMLGACALLPE